MNWLFFQRIFMFFYHILYFVKQFLYSAFVKISVISYVCLKASEAAASTSSSSAACVEPPRCMIWSECEACERQVTQISTSACGATAVVNVFVSIFKFFLGIITVFISSHTHSHHVPTFVHLVNTSKAQQRRLQGSVPKR